MPEAQKRNLEEYVNVGHSEAENHLRTQNAQLQQTLNSANAGRKLTDFLWLNVFGFAYHYLKSRFGRRHKFRFYPVGDDNGIFKMPIGNTATRLALLSDWASDTPESDKIGAVVAAHKPHYSIHLGDVYFVGTPAEIQDNFISPEASWPRGKLGSLALPGNHEMYSNGDAFFKSLLPTMGVREGDSVRTQKASFFCLENDYWRVIGLDTGYTSVGRPFIEILSPPDCHLRREQLRWLRHQLKLENPNDRRGIIFLSHHPPFSAFRKAYPKPAQQLSQLFGDFLRPVLWFWGHEHRLVGYKRREVADLPIEGRCIGHGGMPVEIDPSRNEKEMIAFYDQRKRTTLRRIGVGYNGFAWLTFQNERLTIEYRDVEDKVVVSEKWKIEMDTGMLEKEGMK